MMSATKYNENKPHGKSNGKSNSKKLTLEELQKNAAQDKQQIDALKNAIFEKMKTNNMSKKAAIILENWLTAKEKGGKNPTINKDKKSA